jgi:hypothetical protein
MPLNRIESFRREEGYESEFLKQVQKKFLENKETNGGSMEEDDETCKVVDEEMLWFTKMNKEEEELKFQKSDFGGLICYL